jgi:hypothetical protein
VHAFATPRESVLCGCDMEEEQPQLLVRRTRQAQSTRFEPAPDGGTYEERLQQRKGTELLELLTESPGQTDKILNDISVQQNLLATLQLEKNRLGADRKMIAQNEREQR